MPQPTLHGDRLLLTPPADRHLGLPVGTPSTPPGNTGCWLARTMAVHPASRRVVETVGMRYVRTYFPVWDDALPGSEEGEVEYELTRAAGSAAGGRRVADTD